jgi:hypothetical protein
MKKFKIRPALIVLLLVIISLVIFSIAYYRNPKSSPFENRTVQRHDVVDFTKFKNSTANENCLKCHGQSKYSYENKEAGKKITKRMYSELVIDRNFFYTSNHREFKCIDCHSEDYTAFPHQGNLRMEAMPNCLDCHGGDEKYAQFHFENVEKEFQQSVHSEKHSDEFTCWMCHNAHTYAINVRTNENIKQAIAYDNMICLSCHSDLTRFQILTDKQKPNLIEKHEWLPNQRLHMQSVRCIECHTSKLNDSTFVAHNILPKKEAVKNCVECHATSSVLMASLYKYQVKETRSVRGFFTTAFSEKSYVIGANRNFYLNVVSILIFGMVIIGIIIHAILRIT